MLLQLQSPLLEERVARRAGCGVAAKGGVKADNGYFVAYTTSVICSYLANASFSSRRGLLPRKQQFTILLPGNPLFTFICLFAIILRL